MAFIINCTYVYITCPIKNNNFLRTFVHRRRRFTLCFMELQSAPEYLHELVQLQQTAQSMNIVPQLLWTVKPVNIPGLSAVLYMKYRRTQTRYLTTAHRQMLRLSRCYCHSRCFCIENQALLEWCWLKFASYNELNSVAHALEHYMQKNFWNGLEYTLFNCAG